MSSNKHKNGVLLDAAKIIASLAARRYVSAAAAASKYIKVILISAATIVIAFFILTALIICFPLVLMQSLLPDINFSSMELSSFALTEIGASEQEKKSFIKEFLDSLKVTITSTSTDPDTGETTSTSTTYYAFLADPEPDIELVLILYSVIHEGYFNNASIIQSNVRGLTRSFLEPTGWMGLEVKVKPFERVVSELLKGGSITETQAVIALNMYEIYVFNTLTRLGYFYDEDGDSFIGGSNIAGKGNGELSIPLSNYTYTSGFGIRKHPVTGKPASMHTGVDLAAPLGAPITAANDGTVVFAGVSGTYGLVVIIGHDNGMETLYAHCSRLLVAAGDDVNCGQHIADVGSTGRSTGPHLHFEVRINGIPRNPIDYL